MSKNLTFIQHSPIKPSEIPDIPLYMDQVLDFLEEKLSGYKRSPKDIIFTKTMINNYVKADVLKPPVKKKYSRSMIEDLIMIYAFKQVLSIQDTKQLLKILHSSFENPYEQFIIEEQKILNLLSSNNPGVDTHKIQEDNLSLLSLILEASIKKRISERLIDIHLTSE